MIEINCRHYKRCLLRVEILILVLALFLPCQLGAFVGFQPQSASDTRTAAPALLTAHKIDELLEATLSTAGIDSTRMPRPFRQRVHKHIYHYTVHNRSGLQAMLRRADAYLPMIKRIFQQQALPAYFAYIPFVESSFLPQAHNSKSGARGLWQLMAATARDYGLTVSDELDERIDPERATHAAARHLRLLRRQFGKEAYLHILAAYNYGAGNFNKALRRAQTTEIWPPVRQQYLPFETRNYLAQMTSFWVLLSHPNQFSLLPVSPTAAPKRTRTAATPVVSSARMMSSRTRLAIFDFKRVLADQKYVSEVAEVFRTELAALGAMIIEINDEALEKTAFTDDARIREVGKRLKIDRAVVGSVVQFGETFTINVKAIDMQTGIVSAAQSLSAKTPDALSSLVRQLALVLMPPQTASAGQKTWAQKNVGAIR